VLDSGTLAPRYENMTSSVKPEVNNVSNVVRGPCMATGSKQKWEKQAVQFKSNASRQTDRQTDIIITIIHIPATGTKEKCCCSPTARIGLVIHREPFVVF